MDSHLNKAHLTTNFCVVLSDLMCFWDPSISPSDPKRRHLRYKASNFQDRSRPIASRIQPNFSHFQRSFVSQPWARRNSIILPASSQKSLHLHGSSTSNSCSIFKLRSGFFYRYMIGTGLMSPHWNLIKSN